MAKTDVIILLVNKNNLQKVIGSLNFETVNVVQLVMDDRQGDFFVVDDISIPVCSYADMKPIMTEGKNFYWLICGGWDDSNELKKFLQANGIPREKILNFSLYNHITYDWIANIRYTEKNPIDFFATGISYTEVGLDMKCFPGYRGVNLSCSNSDLRENFLTAKYVFEHSRGGGILNL